MSTAIKVENLSKAYQLGTIGTGTLSRDLERWLAKVRGKEDPFMTIGEANDRSVKGSSDVVLSLNKISFDIEQGGAVGIIGRNGAGKSTLLKLLSRVTSPTSGSIKVKGRIASLLEVGTGFHPELTGRENIFLNGAILGMRKKEIARKFDQIVDFSGVERYIDTPVKRYSSGMYVRLAFAVAAHLESEILIVDEVLAVGDADFQKKCLGKMGEVSKGEGRTVLFVSHNMAAIKNLCQRTILLKNGTVEMDGSTSDVTDAYFLNANSDRKYLYDFSERSDLKEKKVYIKQIAFNNNNPVYYGEDFKITMLFQSNENLDNVNIGIGINSLDGVRVTTIDSDSNAEKQPDMPFTKGENQRSFLLKEFGLSPGIYTFDVAIRAGKETNNTIDFVVQCFCLEILANSNTPGHFIEGDTGGYRPVPNVLY